jgi:hypothetical protein
MKQCALRAFLLVFVVHVCGGGALRAEVASSVSQVSAASVTGNTPLSAADIARMSAEASVASSQFGNQSLVK